MSRSTVNISVALSQDESIATIRMGTRSNPIVTGCLGVDKDKSGKIVKVYLNSLIHRGGKNIHYAGFEPSGAISTILTATS